MPLPNTLVSLGNYTDNLMAKHFAQLAEPTEADRIEMALEEYQANGEVEFSSDEECRDIRTDIVDGELMDDVDFIGQLIETLRKDPIEAQRRLKVAHDAKALALITQAVKDFSF